MSLDDQLTETQKAKLATLPVWINWTAGQVLQWRQDLIHRRANATQQENRELMVKLLMQNVIDQIGDLPLDQWSDQTVRVNVIMPMALDRIHDLANVGTGDAIKEAVMICDAISESLLIIDFLPSGIVAELEQGHAALREELQRVLAKV